MNPRLISIKNFILTIFAATLILGNFYIEHLDGGGYAYGYTHYFSYIIIGALIIAACNSKRLNNRWLLFPAILLALLTYLKTVSISTSDYVFAYSFYFSLVFILITSLILFSQAKATYPIITSILFIGLTISGLLNWRSKLAFGEDRLWRSVDWHNPSATLSGGFIFTFMGLLLAEYYGRKRKYLLASYLTFFGIGVGELYATQSHGGWYVFLIWGFIALILLRKIWKNLAKIILCGLLIAGGFIYLLICIKGGFSANGLTYYGVAVSKTQATAKNNGLILSRSNSPQLGNFMERVRYWKTAWKMFLNRPFLGQGIGSWSSRNWLFRASNEDLATAVHNDYLQTLAEGGILLFLAFLGTTLYPLISGFKKLQNKIKVERPENFATLGAVLGAGFIATHSGLDFNSKYFMTWSLFAVLAGYVLSQKVGDNYNFSNVELPMDKNISAITGQSDITKSEGSEESNGEVINSNKESDRKTKKSRFKLDGKSSLSIGVIIALIISSSGVLGAKAIWDSGKALDGTVVKNKKSSNSVLNTNLAFDTNEVLSNAEVAIQHHLPNLALTEIKLGEVFNPKDERLTELDYILSNGLTAKVNTLNADSLAKILYIKDDHYWSANVIMAIFSEIYSRHYDVASQLLLKFKAETMKHPAWEYFSNMSFILIYQKSIILDQGKACDSLEVKNIDAEFKELMSAAPVGISENASAQYNNLCQTETLLSSIGR